MKFAKWIVLMIVVLATVVACVACGGNTGNSTTSSTSTTTGKPAPKDCGAGKHTVAEWTVTAEPTCERKGSREGVCTVCGKTVTDRLDKIDHSWGEELRREPTCLTTGEIYHVCSVCPEEEQIEELPLVEHSFDVVADTTGNYSYYICKFCETNYIRNTETENDLFYWATNEADYLALPEWNDIFNITPQGFDPFKMPNGNVVAAMREASVNAGIMITDRNNSVLKYEDQIVLQMDIMFDQYPNKMMSLLTLLNSGNYCNTVFINDQGYLAFVDESVFQTPIKDAKLELNTWYNIAVVMDLENLYRGANDAEGYLRLPYQIYLDGELLTLETTKDGEPYVADKGEAGWGTTGTREEATTMQFRIFDYGYSGGGGCTYHAAVDNIRIYSGTEVDAPIRGEIDFGGQKLVVDYPTALDWTSQVTPE